MIVYYLTNTYGNKKGLITVIGVGITLQLNPKQTRIKPLNNYQTLFNEFYELLYIIIQVYQNHFNGLYFKGDLSYAI